MFVMSQLSVCDITFIYCTCVYFMVGLNKHNVMDVQHYISKMKVHSFVTETHHVYSIINYLLAMFIILLIIYWPRLQYY